VGSLLATSSPRLQRGACRALEPFARRHKIPVCQAKVVTALIALSQSPEPLVAKTAGQVLQLLADDLPSVDLS